MGLPGRINAQLEGLFFYPTGVLQASFGVDLGGKELLHEKRS